MIVNQSILKDCDESDLRLSSIMTIDSPVQFKHFSAKYVVSGSEHYLVNSKKFLLNQGYYILGNKVTEGSVCIDSKTAVRGICVDVSKKIIGEVIQYQFQDTDDFSSFLFEKEWVINKYNAKQTTLGYALHQIANQFDKLVVGDVLLTKELFFSIAECIVSDQQKVYTQFQKLTAKKEETNGRLFNFVCDAKLFIEDNFLEKITLETIAQNACLSEYHFIRLFKKVFGITPYQYILEKRLTYAAELLLAKVSIQTVSDSSGFADLASFSKAFKTRYGMAPRKFNALN